MKISLDALILILHKKYIYTISFKTNYGSLSLTVESHRRQQNFSQFLCDQLTDLFASINDRMLSLSSVLFFFVVRRISNIDTWTCNVDTCACVRPRGRHFEYGCMCTCKEETREKSRK